MRVVFIYESRQQKVLIQFENFFVKSKLFEIILPFYSDFHVFAIIIEQMQLVFAIIFLAFPENYRYTQIISLANPIWRDLMRIYTRIPRWMKKRNRKYNGRDTP